MTRSWWKARADVYLRELFVVGRPAPSRKALRDAYPFGPRCYYPYKAWCARVKDWRLAHAAGMASPAAFTTARQRRFRLDTETLNLFDSPHVSQNHKRRHRPTRGPRVPSPDDALPPSPPSDGGAGDAVQPEDHRRA